MFLPWLLISCTLQTPPSPDPDSPAARAVQAISEVSQTAEDLTKQAEDIALMTEQMLQTEAPSDADREALSQQVEQVRAKAQAAQAAFDRATAILAEQKE